MLTTNLDTPVMTNTSVISHSLESFEIIAEFRVDGVGENLRVLAVGDVLLSVQEPCRDLELCGVLEDGDDSLEFIGVELAGAE